MPRPVSHIAVIRLSAMGDVAMTVPVLRAFSKQNPKIKITVVSRAFFRPFFDGLPNVDFFAVDLNGRHKGIFGLFRLKSDLEKLGVDAVADLHNVLRSKVVRTLFSLSGKKVAFIDKGRQDKKALTRAKNKIFQPLRPTVERYADVFRNLGFAVDLAHPEFPVAPEISASVKNFTGGKSGKWIGIAPFAKHAGKVYPKGLMAEVVSGLSEKEDVTVFLFGAGKEEISVLSEFASGKKNVKIAAGNLDFPNELNLIANLDVMLSMDSGNAHIGAMYGVPVITLWGATHPFAGFAPFGQPEENALVADREKFPLLPTSVYGNKIVPGYEEAMRTIGPECVIEKVNEAGKISL